MFTQTTRLIKVTVLPIYLEHQSEPIENHYSWAYNVRIENLGKDTVQLLSRHWKIVDSGGHMKEVKGPGVVGEQPILKPGNSYEYTSGTMLPTPSGVMYGTYQMIDYNGETFDIVIPTFSLDSPHEISKLN